MGNTHLRDIFLKVDNYVGGEYFAKLLKEVRSASEIRKRWLINTRSLENFGFNSLLHCQKKNPERQSLSFAFFHPREKIGFPFWLEDGLGIFGLFETAVGRSMRPSPTLS